MNSKTAKSGKDAQPTFETALGELETIVEQMEAGELTLEQSLAQYKRGAELLRLCQSQLADAQTQIKVLDNDTLKDLDAGEQD